MVLYSSWKLILSLENKENFGSLPNQVSSNASTQIIEEKYPRNSAPLDADEQEMLEEIFAQQEVNQRRASEMMKEYYSE